MELTFLTKSGLARALAAEFRRSSTRAGVWLSLACVGLVAMLTAAILPGGGDLAALRSAQALTATLWPLLPLTAAALSLAQERQSGFLALLASGPVARSQLLAAKALALIAYLVLGAAALFAGAALAATLTGGIQHPLLLAATAALSALTLAPMISLGLACAVFARSPAQAALAALSLHLLLDTAGNAVGFGNFTHTTLWGLPFERAQEALAGLPYAPLSDVSLLAFVTWAFAPLALALAAFRRTNLP